MRPNQGSTALAFASQVQVVTAMAGAAVGGRRHESEREGW